MKLDRNTADLCFGLLLALFVVFLVLTITFTAVGLAVPAWVSIIACVLCFYSAACILDRISKLKKENSSQ